MRGDVTVYSPKNVLCTMGIHIASGFTEDGFITITPQGDGVTDEAGADGVMSGLLRTFAEEHHEVGEGRETEPVTELFDGDGGGD